MAKQPYRLDAWTEGYLSYLLDVSRKAKGTVRDIRCTLKRLDQYMKSHRPFTEFWKLSLEDYLHWLEAERDEGTTPQTMAKYVSHVRGLLDYAWRSGRADRNVLDGFSLPDVGRSEEPRSLTLEEAKDLVDACPKSTKTERADRLIVLLLYGCGLRTDELCSLRVQDVDRERQELLVAHGKGDRQRCIPIPAGVYTELLAYLCERGGKQGLLLRTPSRKRPITARHVCGVVRRVATRVGLGEDVTPRTLRHTFATHLMDRGVDLAVIASLMGHRSPSETGVYLHALGGDKRDAIEKLGQKRKGTKQ